MRKIFLILAIFSAISGQVFAKDLTVENVYACIIENGIYEPEYVLAQSIQETGWYRCTNCSLSRNNILGFRTKKGYLRFDTWEESVEYYQRWQLRKGYVIGEDYSGFLDRIGYATDPLYEGLVKSIMRRLEKDYGIKRDATKG